MIRTLATTLALGAALGLTGWSLPAHADCRGTYDMTLTQLGIQLSAGANYCGQGTGGSTASALTLVDGALPPDLFASDKAYWAAQIASWTLLDQATRDAYTDSVEGAYDGLAESVDDYLVCFPDRLVVTPTSGVNWFGWQSVAVTLIDDDCGGQQTYWTWTTIYGCSLPLAGVLGGDGAFAEGGLAAALGVAWAQLETAARWAQFGFNVLLTGVFQDPNAPQCGLAVGLTAGLTGRIALTKTR